MLKFKKSILLSITAFGMFLALTSCGAKSKDPTTNTDVTPTTDVIPTSDPITSIPVSDPVTSDPVTSIPVTDPVTSTPVTDPITTTEDEVETFYTVNHYQENLDTDGYTIVSSDTIPALSNHNTEAETKLYTGFNAKTFNQQKIKKDGSTVIDIYYDRVRCEITVNDSDKGISTGNGTYKYGQTVNITTEAKTGYEFVGFYSEGAKLSNESTYSFVAEASLNIEARYVNQVIEYKVYHYQENINDNEFTLVEADTQILSGDSFSQTQAEAIDYAGFTAKSFVQEEINPDGSTVIKIYYERIKRTVSISNLNPTRGSATGTGIYKYGQTVTLTASPNTGYTILGWYINNNLVNSNSSYEFVIGLDNVSVTVDFKVAVAQYKVYHYQENINDNGYTLVEADIENLSGDSFSQTEAVAKDYMGFSAKSFEQKEINPNGSTIISIYYDRVVKSVTVTNTNTERGSFTGNGTYKYGQAVTLTATSNTGYTIDGWYINGTCVENIDTYTFTIGTEDVTVELRFKYQNANYTVKHYQENLNDSNYTLVEADTTIVVGTAYSTTNVTANNYTGFTAQTITQQEINPDGSTVVNVYYNRIRCKINATVNVNGRGTTTGTGTYKYGQTVTLTASANDGYKFDGWADSVNGSTYNYSYSRQVTAEYNSKTYYAIFSPQSYNITINNSGISTSNIKLSGTTAGTNKGYYGYQYTVTVTYDGTDFVTIGVGDDVQFAKTYTFTMPAEAITIDVSVSPMVRQGNVVYFGRYPQTLITDSSLKTTLNSKAGSTPTTSSFNGWLAYSYYSSNSTTSYFMFYKDISYNGETYRGVYFNQYRPTSVSAAASTSTSTSFQDDNNYFINTIYWFKYEPIKWQILTEEDGKALIVSDLVLDAKEFYHESQTNQFYHKNEFGYETGKGYANSYELSDIRRWLNAQFGETAIPLSQRGVWSISEVDNSLESTGVTSNTYANDCGTTQDIFFLLSYKELKDYFPVEDDRMASASDYAYCQGISSGSCYWLRSPSNYGGNMTFAQYLNYSSYNSQTVTVTTNGVRPACWINL